MSERQYKSNNINNKSEDTRYIPDNKKQREYDEYRYQNTRRTQNSRTKTPGNGPLWALIIIVILAICASLYFLVSQRLNEQRTIDAHTKYINDSISAARKAELEKFRKNTNADAHAIYMRRDSAYRLFSTPDLNLMGLRGHVKTIKSTTQFSTPDTIVPILPFLASNVTFTWDGQIINQTGQNGLRNYLQQNVSRFIPQFKNEPDIQITTNLKLIKNSYYGDIVVSSPTQNSRLFLHNGLMTSMSLQNSNGTNIFSLSVHNTANHTDSYIVEIFQPTNFTINIVIDYADFDTFGNWHKCDLFILNNESEERNHVASIKRNIDYYPPSTKYTN